MESASACRADDTYTSLLGAANQLLKDGKLAEARQTATTATSLAPDRFEAYFLAGAVAHQQGADADARPLVEKALTLAPQDKKPKIAQFLATLGVGVAPEPAKPAPPTGPPPLDATAQRKLDILTIIVQDADHADTPDKRKQLLGEFLEKSAPFLREHQEQTNIWVMRAVAALELEQEKLAKRAGQKLQELGYGTSQDEKIRKVMAMLDRKGWLIPPAPAVAKTGDWPEQGKPFENTLGMRFVPVPGTEVLFSVWDTRVQDYRAFIQATSTQWPGVDFPQGPTHPAVNVSWLDAKAFCGWLTEKEQQAGRLGPDQEYRLPTDAEWSVAVGLAAEAGTTPREKAGQIKGLYPWGSQWPPPQGAGNYSDTGRYKKYRKDDWMKSDRYIHDYTDGFPDTSPVGSFTANRLGLYDMGGNIWQWCEDWYDIPGQYRVLRGASFLNYDTVDLRSPFRNIITPDDRNGNYGFRCVVGLSSSSP